MGDPRGFLSIGRKTSVYRPVAERLEDYADVVLPRDDAESLDQASRCMDCGTPFCHGACPVGNWIPEWNDLVHQGRWREAYELLNSTNNLPEMTGRLCPALCESACVLGINDDAVTCRENEYAVIERAFREGYAAAATPTRRTGKKVAVVGSGPAGLAAAVQLNRAGHRVTVFERDHEAGGILRYGIPDFKLEKSVIDRRLDLMKAEGIKFRMRADVGNGYPASKLLTDFDAVCLAGGSRAPRDLAVEGRELKGIHFAMDYLSQSNRRVAGRRIPQTQLIDAAGKRVVVIGGGDTGSDCVGTTHRQKAASVVQIEVMPQPSDCRPDDQPWPSFPMILKTTSSHQEGGERHWSVLTQRFTGSQGRVEALECVRVEFPLDPETGCPVMRQVAGSEFSLQAELVILAVGFLGPEREGMLSQLGVELDARGNVSTDEARMTSIEGVFAAGDMRRGQSLIVWAVSEGRKAARAIDLYLMGESVLPEG